MSKKGRSFESTVESGKFPFSTRLHGEQLFLWVSLLEKRREWTIQGIRQKLHSEQGVLQCCMEIAQAHLTASISKGCAQKSI